MDRRNFLKISGLSATIPLGLLVPEVVSASVDTDVEVVDHLERAQITLKNLMERDTVLVALLREGVIHVDGPDDIDVLFNGVGVTGGELRIGLCEGFDRWVLIRVRHPEFLPFEIYCEPSEDICVNVWHEPHGRMYEVKQ